MALRCMATMISVRVKVMAEHAMDHLSADTDCDSSLSFTCGTLTLKLVPGFNVGWNIHRIQNDVLEIV